MDHTTGLTVPEALEQLYNDLKSVLDERDWCGTSGWDWMVRSLSPSCQHTPLSWPGLAIALYAALVLLISSAFDDNSLSPNPFVGLVILLLVGACVYSVLGEEKVRKEEIVHKAERLIESINQLTGNVIWGEEDYPPLSSPPSPCITLQWTYRNGHVVNLPWALLVKGDVILLRPGQVVPGHCVPCEDKSEPELYARDIYLPDIERCGPLPAVRRPRENRKFQLQETPYAANLRLTLEKALHRPMSFHEKERHLVVDLCIERVVVPFVALSVVVINLVRYLHLHEWHPNVSIWQLLLLEPVTAILPLLPLALPVMWRLYNAWGITNIRTVLQAAMPNQTGQDPFEKPLEVDTSSFEFQLQWKSIVEELYGKSSIPLRASNLLHALGSVTGLCCIDKKGILSWPNPSAEKVFFLRYPSAADLQKRAEQNKNRKGQAKQDDESWIPEVLDVTHDKVIPYKLHFDDHEWSKHMRSLKPLGLAILLNTCNAKTQEMYSQFCCHLACETAQDDNLVPVTTRRCLCELSKEIGFQQQVPDGFSLEQTLCTYQQVESGKVRKDIKFVDQLSNTKLKVPLPHMVATTMRDKRRNVLHMMTQGTADLILQSCVEYWDGRQIVPLTPKIRKKILEFYHMNSVSNHCSAFSYRPLTKRLHSSLANNFLEVPSDSRRLYMNHRSPSTHAYNRFQPKTKETLAQFLSNDSLEVELEEEVCDVDGWLALQSNQIFLGMVTMQYQAQPDVVHLIEQLDKACIRFVHFSKENELRSRTFSEKIGIESGWNCHVSLHPDGDRGDESRPPSPVNPPLDQDDDSPELSEADSLLQPAKQESQHDNERSSSLLHSRAMSVSAPSGINADCTVNSDDFGTIAGLSGRFNGSKAEPSSSKERRASQDVTVEIEEPSEQWRSLSDLNLSDQIPFGFDTANRAKLPVGIEAIRPHLEHIDNVPLLVSLYTDSTPLVTRQMIEIMQEYAEVVVVIGSSANSENVEVFLQADSSIAMEPLYPQVCHKQNPAASRSEGPSPLEISGALNSLPCALSMRRQDSLSMYRLIASARQFCLSLRNSLQFWLCCVSSICAIMLLSAILMLPPPLNPGQIILLSCAIVPILSTSLMTVPMDSQIMLKPTGKNECYAKFKVLTYVAWCYGLKSLPSALIVVAWYISGLAVYSHDVARGSNGTVSFVYPTAVLEPEWGGWYSYPRSLLILQHCCSLMFLLHWVAASASFLDRSRQIWRGCVLFELKWLLACVLAVIIQCLYSGAALVFSTTADESSELDETKLPQLMVGLGCGSPLLVLLIDEVVKWQEYKANDRFQRRKRLDFGTKLGMNSPF